MKIPRKKKKQIPSGPYCYKCISYDKDTFSMKVKYCPNYTIIQCKDKPVELQDEIDKEYPNEKIGWCKLLKSELMDDIKYCSINCKYKI